MKKLLGSLHDAKFSAARIGDQGMRGGVAGDFREEIKCSSDGQRYVDKISVTKRGFE
jgi:hypothetical protein